MPEIKHQFTGGKMNKDLDERLVPNGEYRDAMNIQVSTSEDSDVGTVQNILGNELIGGQEFIGAGAFCVGSIADEKNDTVYYFVTENKQLILNGNFDTGSDNWSLSYNETEQKGWQWVDGIIKGNSVPLFNRINQSNLPLNSFIDNQFYEIKFSVSNVSDGNEGEIEIKLANEDGKRFSVDASLINGNGDYKFLRQLGSIDDTTNPNFFSRFYVQRVGNSGFTGDIDNISIKKVGSYIIQHNLKSNNVTPVIVDTQGDVLDFNASRFITGINIIDDMLFWTDNHSEPKKINIPRSIQGTDSSGLFHSNFINEETNIALPIKEEHITVLKKQPALAPAITLNQLRDPNKTYTALTKIFAEQQATDTDGILGASFDFSDFNNIGHVGVIRLFTDIKGNNGFTLDWKVGDTLAIKAYNGADYDEQPPIPLENYNITAVIQSSPLNNIVDSQDSGSITVSANSNFSEPNYNNTAPVGWDISDWSESNQNSNPPTNPTTYNYNSTEDSWSLSVNHPGDYEKISGGHTDFVLGASYRFTVKISNYVNGRLYPRVVIPAEALGVSGDNYIFRGQPGTFYNNNGEYSFDFTASSTADPDTFYRNNTWSNNHASKIVLETRDTSSSGSGVSFTGDIDFARIQRIDGGNAQVQIRVTSVIDPAITVPGGLSELIYVVDRLDENESIFEFKFPRIAYRYRYQDNEYSAISPFSQVAFLPGGFNYHPKNGFNLGMANRLTSIDVNGFNTNTPDDVKEIDIIYKEETSPNLYVVDTIKPKSSGISGIDFWSNNSYNIKNEQIYKAIASNQLIRPWDNVPKTALAQEVVGSRIVYGNYKQGFDLKYNEEDYYPDFNFNFTSSDISNVSVPSIKSLREYQLGVVFVDKYGRETPVVSNFTATKKISKKFGDKQNRLEVSFNNEKFPNDLQYFKFFIKQTSGEYYNMAMDRFYDAGDAQLWLSFPSSDRNKIDIDDFLILKKGVGRDKLVDQEAKYKILDIQNEAPDFIKQKKSLIESLTQDSNATEAIDIFPVDNDELPRLGVDTFKTSYSVFTKSLSRDLHNINDGVLYVEFVNEPTGEASKAYRINKVQTDIDEDESNIEAAEYTFLLEEPFGSDVNFIVNNIDNTTSVVDGTTIQFYKYTVENSAKFDGKFFIKINRNSPIGSNLVDPTALSNENTKYRLLYNKRLYSMDSNIENTHRSDLTGQTLGQYGSSFGRFAPYFRNYPHVSDEFNLDVGDSGNGFAFGQYSFGDSGSAIAQVTEPGLYYQISNTNNNWADELRTITVHNDIEDDPIYNGERFYSFFNLLSFPQVVTRARAADTHNWNKSQRTNNTVWFIDAGPSTGTRWGSQVNSTLEFGENNIDTNDTTGYGFSKSGAELLLEIAIGGVLRNGTYNDEGDITGLQHLYSGLSPNHPSFSHQKTLKNYWNVGVEGGNNNYDNEETISVVDSLNIGTKFRFKEDPNKEVYKVVQDTIYGKVRYNDGLKTDGTQPDDYLWNNTLIRRPGAGGVAPDDPKFDLLGNYGAYGSNGGHYFGFQDLSNWDIQTDVRTAQLSPNFTANYKLKILNSANQPEVAWNPAGALGPIVGGLTMTKAHSTYSGSIVAPTPVAAVVNGEPVCYVFVDDLSATSGVDTVQITTGLILTSHSAQAATPDTLDGSDGQQELLIWKIQEVDQIGFRLYLCGYREPLNLDATAIGITVHNIKSNLPTSGGNLVFQQPAMNGYSQYSCNRINAQDALNQGYSVFDEDMGIIAGTPSIMPVFYNLEILEEVERADALPENPAVWETEPKENTGLDIYYEASGYNALYLSENSKHIALPIGSGVKHVSNSNSMTPSATIDEVEYGYSDDVNILPGFGNYFGTTGGWRIRVEGYYEYFRSVDGGATQDPIYHAQKVGGSNINVGSILKIFKPDGGTVTVEVIGWSGESQGETTTLWIKEKLYGPSSEYVLPYHNCFAFGNGVESNRIRDNFNLPFIANGVKVSTTLDFSSYKEEHRKYGLIYSGLYNANSGINNLNQFIAGEKITKDINPTYGSIQKLHARDSDLITLCEDKVLQILASKDAVFNADGNPQLVATNRVLGQSRPFVGEYGISNNPESFASESYRAYFTDKVRGAVLRLSKDGLTPISDAGMKDWFKDNLKLGDSILGSYDDNKNEYNVTIHAENPYTLSFKENVKGWSSFKSFIPDSGVSCAKDYFTVKEGKLYKHHSENVNRNTFYEGELVNSSFDVVLNESPGSIKSYHTLGYEGSQSKIDKFQNSLDAQMYNLSDKKGWYVSLVNTDKKQGSLNEFIEKEGKWFNYIKGIETEINEDTNFGAFDIQGLGIAESVTGNYIDFNSEINFSIQIGDTVYYQSVDSLGGFNALNNDVQKAGVVVFASEDTVEVDSSGTMPANGQYCMFVKNQVVNMSNLSGYYAIAKFENNSITKAELFSVSSEITESSK